MHARVRLTLIAAAGVVAAALLAVVLVAGVGGKGNDDRLAGVSSRRSSFEGAVMPKGVRAPDFALKDQNGRPISMAALRGKPTVVTFLYTTCEDTCPLEAQQIRGALDELGNDDGVNAVAVAVDPPRDTPKQARRFLAEQRIYDRMRFVLGTRRQLTPVWRGFFIQEQRDDAEHQARVVLLDRRGYQRVGYPGSELTPERIAHDLRLLLRED